MTIYVMGHQSPDADSVCSAIALAALRQQLGEDARPVVQGALNPETRFLLEQANIPAPEQVSSVSGKKLWLVDFSDREQAPADIDQADILGIVDHHKLGNITTRQPLECWIWPVGCCCTIINHLYRYHGLIPSQEVALLMLGAIISDTLHFRSPTTTEQDRQAINELAKLAEIEDLDAWVLQQFNAKANIDGASIEDLLERDYKQFNMNGFAIAVSQLELTDTSILSTRCSELLSQMQQGLSRNGLHTYALLLTDIVREHSTMLLASHDPKLIAEAFSQPLQQQCQLDLPSVVSRKKQVIPPLEAMFATQVA